MRKLLYIIVICVLASSCKSFSIPGDSVQYLEVDRIVDGDTFWAFDSHKKEYKIRLIGVDAPETRNTGRKKIGYYGQQSKEFLTKLISCKKVRLVYDIDKTDQYNRTLAYVYLSDDTFVNAELIKQGFAVVMTIPPNVRYADRFVKLERRARKNKKGLWAKNYYEN